MQHEQGFIALMSVLIIGAVLMIAIAGGGLLGIYSRYNALDFELKERSVAAADACANEALLQFTYSSAYTGSALALNDVDSCQIGNVQLDMPTAGETSFRVQATSSDAVTNLAIVVDSSSLQVLSWKEIPNF